VRDRIQFLREVRRAATTRADLASRPAFRPAHPLAGPLLWLPHHWHPLAES
jgi:hypothetical protein